MVRRIEKVPTQEAIAESISHNTAGRNEDLIDLVKLLDSIEGPYSLLLDAPWGDGKTFFVKSLVEVLKAINPRIANMQDAAVSLKEIADKLEGIKTPFLPFYFNAWEYDFAEDPLSALFANMAIAFDKVGFTKEWSARKCIASVIDASLSAVHLPAIASNMVDAFSGESLIAAYENHALLRERIDELAEQGVLKVANKLVIIIDELDRCRPDFAVRLLEQVKSLFQSDNIIVIISADSLQLSHATAGLYGPGFDSQHFIERFFDLRLTLTPADAYKVATGESLHDTMRCYDLLMRELYDAHNLTIRDYIRLHEKLAAGRNYCDMDDDGTMGSIVAKCLFIPLLIFIERSDTALFRMITRGVDFDALYEYGSQYPTFNSALNEYLTPAVTGQRWDGKTQLEERVKREYVRDICIWLFSTKRDSQECFNARRQIGILAEPDRSVFKTLRFPNGANRHSGLS